MKKLTSGMFAAALVLALPLTANAQEQEAIEGQEECRATVVPIQASEQVQVTATFDAPFGDVTSVQAPERSNITLHTEKADEKAGMAAEGEIGAEGELGARDQMAAENQSTFWLKAENAPAGTYQITLENEAGEQCIAELTVEENAEQDIGLEEDLDAGYPETPETPVEEPQEEGEDW